MEKAQVEWWYRATVEEFAKKMSAGLSGNFLSSTVLLGTAIHQKV
jgi:hypothetical protein